MEMNTRIQVEHPITEQVIDYDLIREQILVAAGIPISGKDYSLSCTPSNAESMRKTRIMISALHPAKLQYYTLGWSGIRLDTHVYAGYTIPPNTIQ